MFYSILAVMFFAGGAMLYDSIVGSAAALDKYKQSQESALLKNEKKLESAIERYQLVYGMPPSSHMDLISSGFVQPADTSILNNRESIIANRYQKIINKFVVDNTKTNAEIKALFDAQTYSTLPIEIKNEIAEDEYNLLKNAKIDYQIMEGKLAYSDDFANSEYNQRVVAIRSSKTLSSDNSIAKGYLAASAELAMVEKQLELAVVALSDENIDKYKLELSSRGYSDEKISSLMTINENKRDLFTHLTQSPSIPILKKSIGK